MRNRLRIIRQYLITLNLFDTDTDDDYVKRNEILSTRIYLITLSLLLAVLTLYTALQTETTLITVKTPSQTQYEQLKLFDDNGLYCPCKQIAIKYKDFLNISPRYHEICSSGFVTQTWIDYLFYENTSYYYQLDFRRDGASKFQILRALCEHAQRRITDSLNAFYSTRLTTNTLISSDVFDVQASSFVDLFQRTVPSSFQTLVQLIRQATISNGLFSAIDTANAYTFYPPSTAPIILTGIYYHEVIDKNFDCYCDNTTVCQFPAGIYAAVERYDHAGSRWLFGPNITSNTANIEATFLIPGMNVGCNPIESLMRSTLECFYERACLNQIGSYIYHSSLSIDAFKVLHASSPKRNATIEVLSNDLFVEQWMIIKSYSKFFDRCQPSFCQYKHDQTQSLIKILATMISLYGGLRLVLNVIIPFGVKFIRRKKQSQQQHDEMTDTGNVHCSFPMNPIKNDFLLVSRRTRAYVLLVAMIKFIFKLNIFSKHSTDELEQRNGRLSTKLYFIVSIVCLIVFGTYIASDRKTKTEFIYHPTQLQFEQLQNQSVHGLQCPCSKISIKYSAFVTVNPFYHQVCSSVFASNLWYDAYAIWNIPSPCYRPSFANLASFYFSLLSTYCRSVNETIYLGLAQFYASDYITAAAISESQFNSDVIPYIRSFQANMQTSYQEQRNLIQSTISDNQMITLRRTNFLLTGLRINNTIELNPSIRGYDNCTCGTNAACHQSVGLCTPKRRHQIQGMLFSCFMSDSLLMSTTECFFNQSCLDTIKLYMRSSAPIYSKLIALNSSKASRYRINETIGTIVNNLFIENWNSIYSYSNYYEKCKPDHCAYMIQQGPSYVSVFTQCLGIYGGLSIIIRFLIPLLVNVTRRKKRQHAGTDLLSENRVTKQVPSMFSAFNIHSNASIHAFHQNQNVEFECVTKWFHQSGKNPTTDSGHPFVFHCLYHHSIHSSSLHFFE